MLVSECFQIAQHAPCAILTITVLFWLDHKYTEVFCQTFLILTCTLSPCGFHIQCCQHFCHGTELWCICCGELNYHHLAITSAYLRPCISSDILNQVAMMSASIKVNDPVQFLKQRWVNLVLVCNRTNCTVFISNHHVKEFVNSSP